MAKVNFATAKEEVRLSIVMTKVQQKSDTLQLSCSSGKDKWLDDWPTESFRYEDVLHYNCDSLTVWYYAIKSTIALHTQG